MRRGVSVRQKMPPPPRHRGLGRRGRGSAAGNGNRGWTAAGELAQFAQHLLYLIGGVDGCHIDDWLLMEHPREVICGQPEACFDDHSGAIRGE